MRATIKTLGCRLNQAESAQLSAELAASGFEVVPFPAACDVCVIHSCAVTAAAERETVRLCRTVRRKSPAAFIVLAGCVAEASADLAHAGVPADWIVPQCEKGGIAAKLAARFGLGACGPQRMQEIVPAFDSTRALLRIQDGCSFGCAYCIVPRARGPSRSRPMAGIIAEARALAARGHRELVLTGANIGTWRESSSDLVDLIETLEGIPEVARLRVGSVEPATVELRLIEHMAASEKLCRYLHLPLQSGDDGVLASMGRRYTASQYMAVIEKAVAAMPLVGVGTDIVTGFPGETQEAFRRTRDLIAAGPFSNLHVFPYSERPGTRAASMDGSVPPATRRERARNLIALGEEKRQSFATRFLGRTVEVLLERRTSAGRMTGWTGEYLEAELADTAATANEVVAFSVRDAVGGRLFDGRQTPDHWQSTETT